jgi:amino acid transporter
VPLESLGFTIVVVVIFGLIFLGSSSAFNAIVSASVVALGLTYGIPVAINCARGRKMLPPTRAFKMSEPLAWFANLLGIAYVILTTVLFVFPPELPVTGSNMNYCIVAFAIVVIISLIQWIVDGRKNYTGPKVDLEELILTATQTHEDAMAAMKVLDNGDEVGDGKVKNV